MARSDALSRRHLFQLAAGAGLSACLPLPAVALSTSKMMTRRIPRTDESVPVVGLGTSDEFNRVPSDGGEQLKAVLTTLVEHGGSVVDTAPAYGDAESILGEFIRELRLADELFLSTKVLESGMAEGLRSLKRSLELLPKSPLDLAMVHNLTDADTQLANLQSLKEAGKLRYIGITTANSGGFEEMERLLRNRRFDFIQVNYSPFEPQAAERVIPIAAEYGVAVMINRPFGNGTYFRRVADRQLPEWTGEFGCQSWAQLSLKYILENRDVTCVLPATSDPRHMADNAAAGSGPLPDATARQRIEDLVQNL